MTVTRADWATPVEGATWLISLLRILALLEYLELEGYCGYTLWYLRRKMMGKNHLSSIKSLTVRSGAYEMHQARRLKEVANSLGRELVVTCIRDPGILDHSDPDVDGLSESWDWSDEDESDDIDGDSG